MPAKSDEVSPVPPQRLPDEKDGTSTLEQGCDPARPTRGEVCNLPTPQRQWAAEQALPPGNKLRSVAFRRSIGAYFEHFNTCFTTNYTAFIQIYIHAIRY